MRHGFECVFRSLQQRRAAQKPSRLKSERCLIVIHFRLGALLDVGKLGLLCGRAVDASQAFAGDGASAFHHLAGYHKFLYALLRREGIHCVEEKFLKNHHKSTSADLTLNSLPGDSLERVFRELQLNIIKFKLLLVLLDQSVFGLGQYLN